jgi:hypothetical protein
MIDDACLVLVLAPCGFHQDFHHHLACLLILLSDFAVSSRHNIRAHFPHIIHDINFHCFLFFVDLCGRGRKLQSSTNKAGSW